GEQRADDDYGSHGQNSWGSPLVFASAPGGEQNQGAGGDCDSRKAHPVKALKALLSHAQLQYESADYNCQQTQWNVDPQSPTPTWTIGEPAAENWPQYGVDAQHTAHNTHELAALTCGDHLSHNRLRGAHHDAGAAALDCTSGNQHAHVVGETTKG